MKEKILFNRQVDDVRELAVFLTKDLCWLRHTGGYIKIREVRPSRNNPVKFGVPFPSYKYDVVARVKPKRKAKRNN